MVISNGYIAQADLKGYLGIGDTDDDARLDIAIEAASRLIDDYCGRTFYDTGTPTTAKTFLGEDPYRLWVPDFSTVTGLEVKTDTTDDGTFDTTWTTDEWQAEPLNPVDGYPYTSIAAVDTRVFPTGSRRANIQITARWGWAAVPKRVEHACAIQAGTIFKRATEGAAPVVTFEGTTLQSSKFLDHQAVLLLDPLRRFHVGAV